MFRELEAYIVKNGNDCCRSEIKNGGGGKKNQNNSLKLKLAKLFQV